MYDLTDFQRDLLYVAASEAEPNGLELKDKFEGYYEKQTHHGRLYPNLDRSSRRDDSKKVNSTSERTTIKLLSVVTVRSRPAVSGKTNTWLPKPDTMNGVSLRRGYALTVSFSSRVISNTIIRAGGSG